MVGLQHAADLGDRDARFGELVGVEGDEDLLLEPAGEVSARDALDPEDVGHDLRSGDVRGSLEPVRIGRGDRGDDDRRCVDVQR